MNSQPQQSNFYDVNKAIQKPNMWQSFQQGQQAAQNQQLIRVTPNRVDNGASSEQMAQVVLKSRALVQACEYMQEARNSDPSHLSLSQIQLGQMCFYYVAGMLNTAQLSDGFTDPEKTFHLCPPAANIREMEAVNAIVEAAHESPGAFKTDPPAQIAVLLGLAKLSACPTGR